MHAQSYKIVFNGEITTGYETGDVKAKLAELFNLNNSQTEVLFNGKRVVIKKDLDGHSAIKYQKFLKQAGVICKIERARDQLAGNHKKKNIGEQIVESINKPANDSINNQISINGLNTKVAGKEKRMANFFVDILLACYVFPFAVGFTLGLLGLGAILDIIPDLLLGLTIILSYYVIFEQCLGKTPAKYITRTQVLTVDGKKPAFAAIVVRNLCRFIPFEAFSFLGEKGWHDQLSKTIVVEAK